MTHWLINKNIVVYYRVRRLVGKEVALPIAMVIDRAIKHCFKLETCSTKEENHEPRSNA